MKDKDFKRQLKNLVNESQLYKLLGDVIDELNTQQKLIRDLSWAIATISPGYYIKHLRNSGINEDEISRILKKRFDISDIHSLNTP